jgi:hypothetical protein
MERFVLTDQKCLSLSRKEKFASLQEDFGEEWEEKLIYTKKGTRQVIIRSATLSQKRETTQLNSGRM